MTHSAPPIDDLAKQILQAAEYRQAPRKPWHRLQVSRDTSLVCAYCLTSLAPCDTSAAVLSYVVSLEHGGPSNDDNRVVSCRSCAKSKGTCDVLSWGASLANQTRERLLARRLRVLEGSANHLTPTRAHAPRQDVLSWLNTRWAHPRCRVFAVHGERHCVIALTPRSGCLASRTTALAALRHRHGGQLHLAGKASLITLETSLFLDAVWDLIELNTLVEVLDIDGFSVPRPREHGRDHWAMHLSTIDELRRRGNLFRGIAPYDRVPSVSAAAARKRAARVEQKRLDTLAAWRSARSSLDQLKADVETGRALAPTAIEWLALERDVLERYEQVIALSGSPEPESTSSGGRVSFSPLRAKCTPLHQ